MTAGRMISKDLIALSARLFEIGMFPSSRKRVRYPEAPGVLIFHKALTIQQASIMFPPLTSAAYYATMVTVQGLFCCFAAADIFSGRLRGLSASGQPVEVLFTERKSS